MMSLSKRDRLNKEKIFSKFVKFFQKKSNLGRNNQFLEVLSNLPEIKKFSPLLKEEELFQGEKKKEIFQKLLAFYFLLKVFKEESIYFEDFLFFFPSLSLKGEYVYFGEGEKGGAWGRYKVLPLRIKDNLFFIPFKAWNENEEMGKLWMDLKRVLFLESSFPVENFEEIEKKFILMNVLEIGRLSQKGEEVLLRFFPVLSLNDLEALKEIKKRFVRSRKGVLLFGEISQEILKKLISKEVFKSGRYVLVFLKNLKNLEVLNEGAGGFKCGVFTKEEYKKFKVSPLLGAISAFDHLARLKREGNLIFNGFTLHVMADLLFEFGDYLGALKFYEKGRPYTEQPFELRLSEAACFYYIGDLKRAEEILRGLLKEVESPQKRSEVFYNLGLIEFKKKNLEGALKHFKRALEDWEGNHPAREMLFKTLWDLGEIDEILKISSTKSQLGLKELEIYGKALFLKKEYTKAYEILKKFLTARERDGETLFFLAWLYLILKKDRGATEILFKEARESLGEEVYTRLLKEFSFLTKESSEKKA